MFTRLAFVFALAAWAAAELVIREAGVSLKVGPVLNQNTNFCPTDFSAAGFSVECRGVTGPVTFKVNGAAVRTEGVAPYMIAGDFNGNINAWTSYPTGVFTVACEAASGTETVSLAVQCNSTPPPPGPTVTPATTPSAAAATVAPPPPPPSPVPTPAATNPVEMVIREAGSNGKMGPVLSEGITFCPTDFSAAGFSVECRGAPGPAVFYVDNVWKRQEGAAPYMINGDNGGVIYAWTDYPANGFSIKCETPTASKTVNVIISCGTSQPVNPPTIPTPPTMGEPPVSSKTACVRMTGAMNNGLNTNWEVDGTSIWYLKGSTNGNVFPGGTSDLTFTFTAPVSGTYYITAEMTTGTVTDFNDFWFRFPGVGLTLKRLATDKDPNPSTKQKTGAEYVKAYHNANGRATAAWSVDHDPHAISTRIPLVAGQEYTITVGARSTNLQIHNIILFPCEGDECVPYSSVFSNGVGRCKARPTGSSQ